MAIRTILNEKEEVLHKVCRPVTEFNERLWSQLDDMAETLEESTGVGLAAPQVGILRRFFIMDVGDGLVEAINPIIIAKKARRTARKGAFPAPANGEWSNDR